MLSVIPITEYVGWVKSDNTINFKALDAHITFVNAKTHGIETHANGTKIVSPPSGDIPGEAAENEKDGYRVGSIDVGADDKKYSWFGTIEVGTPRKRFTVDLDTGSSDLFLPGISCTVNACKGHTLWNPLHSSTAVGMCKSFSLSFGGGCTVVGEQFTDTVSIAGYTATTQTLGVASDYSTQLRLKKFPADGLLGLGFEKQSRFSASPLIQTLFSQGQITEPVFSIKLASPGGELYIGGAKRERYTGEFTYTPVLSDRSWQVTLENIQVDGKTILSDIKCIIDTGAALVLGRNDQVVALYKAIGGRPADRKDPEDPEDLRYHYYSFSRDSFPTISFTFGGTRFPIPPSVLNIGNVSDDSSECLSGLVGHDHVNVINPNWIVGAVFLQSVYTTFDLGVEGKRKPRIGFAKLAGA